MAPPSYAFPELPFPTLTPLVDVFLQLSSFCLPVHLFNYWSTLGDGRPGEQPPRLRRAAVNCQVNTRVSEEMASVVSSDEWIWGGLNKEMEAWIKAGDPGDWRKASSVRYEAEGC